MAYCTSCGNQVDDASRFCTSCGATLGSTPSTPVETPTAPAPPTASLTRVTSSSTWVGLSLLLVCGAMGLTAIFLHWSGDSSAGDWFSGIDWIKYSELFEESEAAPWWVGLLAIIAIVGVVLVGASLFKNVFFSSAPSGPSGTGVLGGVLIAVAPIATHVGFWIWIIRKFGGDSGDVWDAAWESDGVGLWLALAGGIIAISGAITFRK